MISKNQIKFITQLKLKKYRYLHKCFVVEGKKSINELLNSSFKLQYLYTTEEFNVDVSEKIRITEQELKKISFLKTPNTALAIFKIPDPIAIDAQNLIVALDNVRDPGNLGTIIRLCDWFGVKDLVCNTETVDCYNPKVVQATMGSISRVNITYLGLPEFINTFSEVTFGTFMKGNNVYKKALPKSGVLILGNEANGISKEIENLVDEKISIPQFGNNHTTESLNVATAAAILLSEFKR